MSVSELAAEEAGEREPAAPLEPQATEPDEETPELPDEFQIAPCSQEELLFAYRVFETHLFGSPEEKMFAASFQSKLAQASKVHRG